MREATVPRGAAAAATAKMTDVRTTRRGVLASLGADGIETLMLAVAAGVTGSVALRSQVAASAADVAVQVFLLIGVLSSARPSDEAHPLGYGRERFFWSFLAALGIFVGGGGFALEGAVRSVLHPSLPDHYTIAYAVLGVTVALDGFALETGLRPLRRQAAGRGISLRTLIRHSTDPAATTVVVGGGSGVIGGLVALVGLVVSQDTRERNPRHGGEHAHRLVTPGRLGVLAAQQPGASGGSRRPRVHVARHEGSRGGTAGRCRRPGPVRRRARALQPDRQRRCRVRRRPGCTRS